MIKKTEFFLMLFVLLGLIAEKIDFPAAVLLILFSFMLLSVFYFLFGFALFNGIEYKDILVSDTYKKTRTWKIIMGVVMGWLNSIMVGGILFTVQGYPGAELLLFVSIFPLALLDMAAFFVLHPEAEDKYRLSLFWRNYVLLGLGFLAWFAL
ncbi:MAG: hypothetical protein K9H84_05015 [Bacteroidales bacterium]|nr:hypothetical protein [Bacteroidales bacterium]